MCATWVTVWCVQVGCVSFGVGVSWLRLAFVVVVSWVSSVKRRLLGVGQNRVEVLALCANNRRGHV